MKTLRILTVGVFAALAIFAIGCGGESDNAATEGGPPVVSPGGGLVAPNVFLEFEAGGYQLVHFLQVDLVPASEFTAIGDATSASIALKGGLTVYERAGDSEAVYTLSPATEDDGALWLRWRKT